MMRAPQVTRERLPSAPQTVTNGIWFYRWDNLTQGTRAVSWDLLVTLLNSAIGTFATGSGGQAPFSFYVVTSTSGEPLPLDSLLSLNQSSTVPVAVKRASYRHLDDVEMGSPATSEPIFLLRGEIEVELYQARSVAVGFRPPSVFRSYSTSQAYLNVEVPA